MGWLHAVSYASGGVLVTNGLPHLISGLMGQAFQSPFARPPGKKLSSSTVNVLWACANLIAAYLLVYHVGAFNLHSASHAAAFGTGVLLASLVLARTFGRLHGGHTPRRQGQS